MVGEGDTFLQPLIELHEVIACVVIVRQRVATAGRQVVLRVQACIADRENTFLRPRQCLVTEVGGKYLAAVVQARFLEQDRQ
ncbi:hypothetical protein D3C81_1924070 [compost metagenome]